MKITKETRRFANGGTPCAAPGPNDTAKPSDSKDRTIPTVSVRVSILLDIVVEGSGDPVNEQVIRFVHKSI
jgi:hypothetical protein